MNRHIPYPAHRPAQLRRCRTDSMRGTGARQGQLITTGGNNERTDHGLLTGRPIKAIYSG